MLSFLSMDFLCWRRAKGRACAYSYLKASIGFKFAAL